MDNSKVGSNSPKSCTKRWARLSSKISSSSAFSIIKEASSVVIISDCLGVACGCVSNLISEAFCMVGFKVVLSISKDDGVSLSITCMFVHSSLGFSSIIGLFVKVVTGTLASSSISESTTFSVSSSFSSSTATGAGFASKKSFNLSGETLTLKIKNTITLKTKIIIVPISPA